MNDSDPGLRTIAFYLPQFHPADVNDAAWGRGFTEWRNVVRARPLFKHHYQPHLPADLGFYDLRVPETREAQAALARTYRVHGFCYYHYWFHGQRLLNRPFDEVLASGKPDFPFCLCWANETWTKAWDRRGKEVLVQQAYSLQDDIEHVRHLIPAFRDDRYIRIDGRPLLLVYRVSELPDARRTAETWRRECRIAGLADVFLVSVEADGAAPEANPSDFGFDAAVEFAPDWSSLPKRLFHEDEWNLRERVNRLLSRARLVSPAYRQHRVFAYADLVRNMCAKSAPAHVRFRCVAPAWDNSPRREMGATIFTGSTPELFESWVAAMASETIRRNDRGRRLLFVNAWNEWAEGAHLEPDARWGRAYLDATARGLALGTLRSGDTGVGRTSRVGHEHQL